MTLQNRACLNICRTEGRLIPHIGVRVDKVIHLVCWEDARLNEAEQRVKFLQVVLDRGPCQQDSKSNRELCKKQKVLKQKLQSGKHERSYKRAPRVAQYLSQDLVQHRILIL